MNTIYADSQKFKDLGNIYRNMINDIKVLELWEIDQIVEAAQSDNFPIVSAKAWVIAEPKKGVIIHGKE